MSAVEEKLLKLPQLFERFPIFFSRYVSRGYRTGTLPRQSRGLTDLHRTSHRSGAQYADPKSPPRMTPLSGIWLHQSARHCKWQEVSTQICCVRVSATLRQHPRAS